MSLTSEGRKRILEAGDWRPTHADLFRREGWKRIRIASAAPVMVLTAGETVTVQPGQALIVAAVEIR